MILQTLLPERWVIVDDGSTDATPQLIDKYASRHAWIEVVHREHRLHRNFAGKVSAFNAGLERVRSLEIDVIGNLDGDVSFDPDYLDFLISKFAQDPQLGVAGTRSSSRAMIRRAIASKAKLTCPVAVNYFAASASNRSAVTCRTRPAVLTGLQ
jgi:poly-beta-1,6-N-acetyl-D-glucosamine synthase